jgi:hypothetical protein
MSEREYDIVAAAPVFTVRTVVPYAEEPEYREYEVTSEELPALLDELRAPDHAEEVVWVREADD